MVPDRDSDNLRNIFIMILEKFLFRQYSMAGISKKAGDLKTMNTGDIAPGFTLPDKDGKMISLSDFAGKNVVLYFYPKDNTPGCTRQACGFAANFSEFEKRDIVVIGVSRDSSTSHRRFAEKHNLPFILLSDPELQAIRAYGVWQEKKLYGKVSMGIVRTTFIIGRDGTVVKVMPKVKPDTNAAEVLAEFD